MTNTRVDMPIHCPHHTVRAWTVDAKCSWCEIAELRAEIERLQTALDAETPSIEVVYEPPADEPPEQRYTCRIEGCPGEHVNKHALCRPKAGNSPKQQAAPNANADSALGSYSERQQATLGPDYCGNWPCRLPKYHTGPCNSSPFAATEPL